MNLDHAKSLALELMNEHGLHNWTFGFDRATGRAGLCSFRKLHISMSRIITEASSEDSVRNTILHEIAHALAGPAAKHGYSWRATFIRIGGSGATQLRMDEGIKKAIHDASKYASKCDDCGAEYFMKRRGSNFNNLLCGSLICVSSRKTGGVKVRLVWRDQKTGAIAA